MITTHRIINTLRSTNASFRRIARAVLIVIGAAGIVGATIHPAGAQTSLDPQPSRDQQARWEFLVSSGNIVPTGAQRDVIKRGNLTVAQVSYVLARPIAVTGSLGWARTRDIATAGHPRLNVFTYDLGTEFRSPRWTLSESLNLRTFAGVGAGARSYDYRGQQSAAQHNVSGYVSAGGELGFHRVGLRLEVRDYASGFTSLAGGGATRTRNDIVVMAGLRLGVRK